MDVGDSIVINLSLENNQNSNQYHDNKKTKFCTELIPFDLDRYNFKNNQVKNQNFGIPTLKRLNKNPNSIVKFDGFVNSCPVRVLLDTGAICSAIDLNIVNKLENVHINEIENVEIFAANRQLLDIVGEITAEIRFLII